MDFFKGFMKYYVFIKIATQPKVRTTNAHKITTETPLYSWYTWTKENIKLLTCSGQQALRRCHSILSECQIQTQQLDDNSTHKFTEKARSTSLFVKSLINPHQNHLLVPHHAPLEEMSNYTTKIDYIKLFLVINFNKLAE